MINNTYMRFCFLFSRIRHFVVIDVSDISDCLASSSSTLLTLIDILIMLLLCITLLVWLNRLTFNAKSRYCSTSLADEFHKFKYRYWKRAHVTFYYLHFFLHCASCFGQHSEDFINMKRTKNTQKQFVNHVKWCPMFVRVQSKKSVQYSYL